MKRISALLAGLLLCVTLCTACSSFERTTFQTLSTSKALLDQAQADYESKVLPHTTATYNVITKGKTIQKDAVDAMVTYETYKATKTGSLSSQQAAVIVILVQLPTVLADVKALYGGAK